MLTLDIENYATRCLKYVIIFVIIVIVKGIHGPKRTLHPYIETETQMKPSM
jgi:hypothetical protein